MKKVGTYLKNNWLMLLIIILPILDIITYFRLDKPGSIIFTLFRFGILIGIFLYSFIKAQNKNKYIFFGLVVLLYLIGHIIGCSIEGYINIVEDMENMARLLYVPVLLLSFKEIFLDNAKKYEKQIVKGCIIAFIIVFISILLAILTKSVVYTYGDSIWYGVIGWFYNKNTQSIILVILSLISVIYCLKNKWYYLIGALVFLALYFNATKTAYLSLILLTCLMIFYAWLEVKDKKKVLYGVLLFILAIGLYRYSPTYNNANKYNEAQNNNNKINYNENITNNKKDNKNKFENDENIKKYYIEVYTMFHLDGLIDNFGIEKVVAKYDYAVDAFILSNTRLTKKIGARLIYDEEGIVSHMFGFEFTKINHLDKGNTLDLENDITALFYYLGYVGFTLYWIFILYYVVIILKKLLFNLNYLFKSDYMIWLILTAILLFGAEFSGALLRRPNASIYFAMILALAFVKFNKEEKLKDKVTFLALHLGYGGIESSIINTSNALSKTNKVEIISFYNLKNNQEHLLAKEVKVYHLYNGEPNREAFKQSLKNKNIINIFKEGFKAVKILFLKKYLIIKTIKNSDSKIIISTRYDFSKLLGKYKKDGVIAIAQEHHHHNNNKKYINILKKKYQKIDYLMALTPSLAQDYQEFLKKNKHTKIMIMPNMLNNKDYKISDLSKQNVLSVGRLHEGKKVNELIDIVAKCPNVNKFYIIGDGEEKEKLAQKIKELKLEEKVELLGYLEPQEQEKYYQKCSIFLMASVSEGLPMVLLEAMGHGLLCIAYETKSGVADIIKDGSNGYVIKNRNENDFVLKLNDIIVNKTKLKEMQKKALETAQEYREENITQKWLKLIANSQLSFLDLFAKLYKGSKEAYLTKLEQIIKNEQKKFIITANPEAFMLAKKEDSYLEMLMDKDVDVIADGIGLVKTGKMLNFDIKERIPGVDVALELFKLANKYQKKVYLYGAKQEVITAMEKLIKESYPNIVLVGAKNGYTNDSSEVFEDMLKKEPDVVLVALGMPKQEELIYKYLDQFNKGIFVGVGGSFDVLSGMKKRAPKIFIKLNLEWLYRILKEPKRFKRFYDNNVKFIGEVQKLKKKERR